MLLRGAKQSHTGRVAVQVRPVQSAIVSSLAMKWLKEFYTDVVLALDSNSLASFLKVITYSKKL
jgi:hypothetical protein